MNTYKQEKAIEALERRKELKSKQRCSMTVHLIAYCKLHCDGIILPYRILYDIEKRVLEKTFNEIPPNRFYPKPDITLEIYSLMPKPGDSNYIKSLNEYKKKVEAEKMDSDKWDYYYARFLLPYDLEAFSDFDFLGEIPKNDNERQTLQNFKELCIEVQQDCKKHPENYFSETGRGDGVQY